MKLTKTELKQKISDKIEDEELVIELLEDIEDSMIEENSTESILDETAKRELEDLKWKYDDLKRKYKERFLETKKEDIEDEEKEELEEKEIIDVKEI